MSAEWQKLERVAPERRIYIDLDDVLAETTLHIVDLLNARFDRSITFADLHDFDLGLCFGLDDAERALAMHCVHEESFLLGLPVREGARDVLRAWSEAGYHLAVVTGRPPDTTAVSSEWLSARDIPHHSFHCIDKYGRYAETNEHTTLDRLHGFSFEIAIEDSPDMAHFLARHSGGTVLLMDRPWNRSCPTLPDHPEPGIHRAHTWRDVELHRSANRRAEDREG